MNRVGAHDLVLAETSSGKNVDPSLIPLRTLARVRGSMWCTRWDGAYGPRPGQPSNILAMDYYEWYQKSERDRMRAIYKMPGFTHSVTGPVVDTFGYHGTYPTQPNIPTQAQWDFYLDCLQEQWNDALVPIYFAKPDGWNDPVHNRGMDQLDVFHRQPRAQRLLRAVCYAGWEPSGGKYDWNNRLYVAWAQRAADVFPNAVRFLHTVSDLDAPTGLDDDHVLGKNGNAVSWQRIAPYLHGWLDQLAGYTNSRSEVPSAQFLNDFRAHMIRVRRGFHEGYNEWPTNSAWGDRPLLHIAAEYASYKNFWDNWNNVYAGQIGDLAIASGADGYLDHGTVDVP